MKNMAFVSIYLLMNRRTRHRTSLRTEIWIGENGIFTRTPDILRDLSEGGAFIQTQQQFSKGSVLTLCFDLPFTGRRIASTVVVRHQREGAGVGVEFLDLSPDDQIELRHFVGDQVARVA